MHLDARTLQLACWIWIGIAAVTGAALLRTTAPYGRHARNGWGPRVPAALAWIVMEAPSPVLMALIYWTGDRRGDPASLIFLVLWIGHYVYRSLVFPFLGKGRKAAMPLGVIASAIAFNGINASLNGLWLFDVGPVRSRGWLSDPRFVVGLALFLVGFAVHVWADARLRSLRSDGASGYAIPRGGLFELVSCPNYFGELLEWTGFALLTWSLPALSFAVWTSANLVPRAVSHHRWYRQTFPEYPPERRATIPWLV